MSDSNKNHTVYRLPPCPAYDIGGMENWLSDMAQRGLMLKEDGFFAGIASFERCTPTFARYRLEAAQKSTSMWADDGGEPDPEQVELGKKYSWEYVAKRGDFYIYRSTDPNARELNTDPQVQVLALNCVKKRRLSSVFGLVFWLVVYPLCVIANGPLLTVIQMRTWLFALTALFVLWILYDLLLEVIHLGRVQRQLAEGKTPVSDWRRRSAPYHGKKLAQLLLAAALIAIFANNWSVSVLNEDKIPLGEYDGKLPFATMSDIAGGDVVDYQMTMQGMDLGFNCLSQWSDLLAPVNISYGEHAKLTLGDSRVINGGLYVDYHRAVSPFIAQILAYEYYRIGSRKDGFEPIASPDVKADYVAAYYDYLHFPNVIIRKGSVICHVQFYQLSEDGIPIEEWAAAVADSIAA